MQIRIVTNRRSWLAGSTDKTYGNDDVGTEFLAMVKLNNHSPGTPAVLKRLRIERVAGSKTVFVNIVGY